MFEEGQLYSPVTRSGSGDVTVHLSDDHPGAVDPEYRARRNALAALAMEWQPGTPPPAAPYTEAEHEVWRIVCGELHASARAAGLRRLSRGQAAAGAAGGPHPAARRGERAAAPADRVPATCRPPGWCRCWSSTARSRTGSSTRRSTSGTTRCRSTRPSPTSCTRSSGTGTASPTTGSPRLYRLAGDAARRVQTDRGAGVRLQGLLVLPGVRRGARGRRGALLRRGPAVLLRRDPAGRPGRPPAAGHRADGRADLRHHALPADPVLRRTASARSRTWWAGSSPRWTTIRCSDCCTTKPALT